MRQQRSGVVVYNQAPAAAGVIAVMLFLGAAFALAVGCILLAKFGKNLVTAPTIMGALRQSLMWAVGLTALIFISAFIWMFFVYDEDYPRRVFSGPGADGQLVLNALVAPATAFFLDVFASLFVANRVKAVVGDRKWICTAVTALLMFVIFGSSSILAFLLSMPSIEVLAMAPQIIFDHLIGIAASVFGLAVTLVTDFSAGLQRLLAMADVRGNFFRLTDVMSRTFFLVAFLTALGFIGASVGAFGAPDRS